MFSVVKIFAPTLVVMGAPRPVGFISPHQPLDGVDVPVGPPHSSDVPTVRWSAWHVSEPPIRPGTHDPIRGVPSFISQWAYDTSTTRWHLTRSWRESIYGEESINDDH